MSKQIIPMKPKNKPINNPDRQSIKRVMKKMGFNNRKQYKKWLKKVRTNKREVENANQNQD